MAVLDTALLHGAGEIWKPEFLNAVIFIIDQIKSNATIFKGFQYV